MLARLAALALVGAVLGAQTPSDWETGGFRQVEAQRIGRTSLYPDGEPTGLTHELDLTAVVLRGSNWNANRAVGHLRRTAGIFGRCGVALGSVTLVEAESPAGKPHVDFTAPVPGTDLPQAVHDLAAAVPDGAAWPVVFFAGRLDGIEDLARSFQRGDVPAADLPRYPYMNTAWMAYKAHWIERREEEYSTLAHEVGHLLCECGHTRGSERHLLHEFRNFLGANVLPEHCVAFLESPLVRPRGAR